MTTALELAVLEWRPASLRDLDDLPAQVVTDYWAIREGQASRAEPFGWFRPDRQGVELSHMFRIGPDGPEELARCGRDREPVPHRRADEGAVRCQVCTAKAGGQPTSVGTIGDLAEEEARLARGG